MGTKFRDKVCQPWYAVEERYGLVFAYMGPPQKTPVLPRRRSGSPPTTGSLDSGRGHV